MGFSDDILMAYAGGGLDQATRAEIESAMERDAVLAQRVAAHQAQLQRQAQPRMAVPRRGATVVQLAAVRATRAATQQAARRARKVQHWSWLEWSAVFMAMALGAAAGKFLLTDWQPEAQAPASVAWRDGALIAQGRLALALDQAPGGAAGVYGGTVRIASSFVATDGSYCRGFTATSSGQEMAGLACKSGGAWKLPIWMQTTKPAQAGAVKAGLDLPAAVQAVMEQRSGGQLLDAAAEHDALQKGWVR
ncbi:hypothetical protein GJ700_26770 [Duganella sp. FT92W]|uniref:Anti-sigma factor n=1 Tax=Pseudoduganella rivuli TaxID=2666085 RepID=A0A7X2ISK6_9BURK|nr:hypothetical protein [Pseudoduganella rivuli]MRV75325.1 hypothetical protein [Pseudoduganella rivuli]